jgi:hypothetical protein
VQVHACMPWHQLLHITHYINHITALHPTGWGRDVEHYCDAYNLVSNTGPTPPTWTAPVAKGLNLAPMT